MSELCTPNKTSSKRADNQTGDQRSAAVKKNDKKSPTIKSETQADDRYHLGVWYGQGSRYATRTSDTRKTKSKEQFEATTQVLRFVAWLRRYVDRYVQPVVDETGVIAPLSGSRLVVLIDSRSVATCSLLKQRRSRKAPHSAYNHLCRLHKFFAHFRAVPDLLSNDLASGQSETTKGIYETSSYEYEASLSRSQATRKSSAWSILKHDELAPSRTTNGGKKKLRTGRWYLKFGCACQARFQHCSACQDFRPAVKGHAGALILTPSDVGLRSRVITATQSIKGPGPLLHRPSSTHHSSTANHKPTRYGDPCLCCSSLKSLDERRRPQRTT